MNIISNITLPCRIPAVTATIGFFDGVHLGHRHLIADVMADAAKNSMDSMVVSFDIHPRMIVRQDFVPQLLSTSEEKASMIAQTGIGYYCPLHFDRNMAELSARDFMKTVLKERLNVRRLIIGYDNRFGHNRSEGFTDYVEFGRSMGIEVVQSDPLDIDGRRVSSSLIRECLCRGDVAAAGRFLGHPYSIEAPVAEGFRLGRSIGFRTANLDITKIGKLIPGDGVYATCIRIDGDGRWLPAMTNVGRIPTFDRADISVETFIFDFDADLYGHRLEVVFRHRLRDERRFSGKEELAEQLRADEHMARQLLQQTR